MVTNLQKAEADRSAIETTIDMLELAVGDHAAIPLTQPAVESYLQMADNAKKDLFENLTKILHCLPTDPVPHQTEFSSLLRRAVSVHGALHGILSAFPVATTASTSAAASASGACHGHSTPHELKLPALQIPHFYGDLQQWISFRDMFKATVHSKTTISKIEKLSYLKTLVHGEAARQIEDIILSDSNYDIAWKALTDRYNNERELLFSITSKLVNQQSLSSPSAVAIRQLMDTTKSCMRSLDILKVKTDECRPIILYLVFSKLDTSTRETWLQSLTSKDIPALDSLWTFLEQRAAALVPAAASSISKSKGSNQQQQHKAQAHHAQAADKCSAGCNETHRLFQCEKFLNMTVKDKIDHLVKNRSCFNCLAPGHSAKMCRSQGTCKMCGKRHNSLIHQGQQQSIKEPTQGGNKQTASSYHTELNGDLPKTILATAIVKIDTYYGPIFARALLDSCSSNCIITENFVKKFNLKVDSINCDVEGLGQANVGSAAGLTSFIIKPHFCSKTEVPVTALLMQNITGKQPPNRLDHSQCPHLDNLELADPKYYLPNNIDILLGGDIFWSLLKFGGCDKITGGEGKPFAVNSILGWLVVGPATSSPKLTIRTMVTNIQLNQQLDRFFTAESLPETATVANRTPEEEKCEQIFKSQVTRLPNGRFVVPIPWRENKKDIGATRHLAVQQLKQMERRLSSSKHAENQKMYTKFMREYIELGHMTEIPKEEVVRKDIQVFYIPHHFVLKLDSLSTRLRVVFNGSLKSSSGVSLNDAMMIGPVVQSSLFDIILRFRLYPIAFTSDTEKMYRQMLIQEKERDMHRIVWRENAEEEIREFRLNTVTYGTAAAPYLATRALVHLAEESKSKYPIASELLTSSVYVDDLMACQPSVSQAVTTIQQLIEIGESAQLSFRKWSCNNAEVLDSIPEELRGTKSLVPMDEDIVIKTLGIYWNPVEDIYQFKIKFAAEQEEDTKRSVLSDMSKLFDPLGWLAPVTIRAKLLMQQIWKEQINWDDKIPINIQQQWNLYKKMLSSLEEVTIPRHFPYVECTNVSLIGFADSSLKAYAAVIYLYGFMASGEIKTCLVTSKTRVASINSPTLPRLELNAAVLLAELLTSVKPALRIKIDNVQAFSDSTIVLAWINSDANRWKMYVKNRVMKIQALLPATKWAHVKGTENPADCASRGLNGDELATHSLWWRGNTDVVLNPHTVKQCDFTSVKHEERKDIAFVHLTVQEVPFLQQFSSLHRLIVFVAAIIRIQDYIRSGKQVMKKGSFSVDENSSALLAIAKCVQVTSFAQELHVLRNSTGQLDKNNRLLSLNPFIDAKGILRVGGRLRHAKISSSRRHPILLPRNHHVTKLIINDIHDKYFHCGSQQTLAILNQRFWITNGRDIVRYVLKKCVVCRRHSAQFLQQQMGDLPRTRVNPARAFLNTGVDFAGPFTIRNIGRSKIVQKVYLSVFVCLVTKALHVEVVSSLSTDAFLAAFRRFISRRGRPLETYSDCGTNFVGADRELREMFAFQHENKQAIRDHAAKDGIRWNFNPPGAPHMGGLWEAGVKSIKYHLRRVLSSHQLTFEEFETLIIQIEGLLNSRPITAVSADPNDLEVLTPAHFLIGESIVGLPERDLSDVKIGRLDRWQLLQQKQQSFWKRWSLEYITRMQQRPKWMRPSRPIQLNDVVIIKDENQPPGKWKLGRVTELHSGEDGLTRVVTLKTANGFMKRPIVKLCVLFDQNE